MSVTVLDDWVCVYVFFLMAGRDYCHVKAGPHGESRQPDVRGHAHGFDRACCVRSKCFTAMVQIFDGIVSHEKKKKKSKMRHLCHTILSIGGVRVELS